MKHHKQKWLYLYTTAFLTELTEIELCAVIDLETDTSADDLADTFDSVNRGLLDKHKRFRDHCARAFSSAFDWQRIPIPFASFVN